MHQSFAPRLNRSTGFTLVEVLIVVGIIAVLAAILIPVVSHARQQAKNTACVNNLRQIGIFMTGYASEQGGNLPTQALTGTQTHWPWDVPDGMLKAFGIGSDKAGTPLPDGALKRDTLFCPLSSDITNTDFLWTCQWPGFRPLGYFFLNQRNNESLLLHGSVHSPGLTPPKTMKTSLLISIPNPEDGELVTDAVTSQNGNFAAVFGAAMGASGHVRGTIATGGNILFLDGHVAWRPLKLDSAGTPLPNSEMQVRTTYSDYTGFHYFYF